MTQDPRFGGRPANDSAAWGQRDKPRLNPLLIVAAVFALMFAGGAAAWFVFAAKTEPAVAASPSPAGMVAPAAGARMIRIETLQNGTGTTPNGTDVALVNYRMLLMDGKVVDQAQQAVFPIDQLVPGVTQAMVQMRRGGKYKVFVPSELGYGAQGAGPIPPNADMIFEVEMIDFKTRAEIEQAQAQMQTGKPK